MIYFFFPPPLPLSGACDSAEAATLFCDGVDFGLLRIFEACEATDLDVRSLFAMMVLPITSARPHGLSDRLMLAVNLSTYALARLTRVVSLAHRLLA